MSINHELQVQIIQALITLIGLLFIWYQIRRGRKDSMTSSIVSSLNERKLEIEKRKFSISEEDKRVYYKFLIPRLNEILYEEYKGDLHGLAKDYIFNEVDWKLKDKEKVFKILDFHLFK